MRRGLRVLSNRCKGPTPSFLSARAGASDKKKAFLKNAKWNVRGWTMDQITIKTPNPKCRLFLIIDLYNGSGGRCLSV
jgi:hypothetical protein